MADKKPTVFQSLERALRGNFGTPSSNHVNMYDMSNMQNIIYKTDNKEDYESKKLELQQNKYLKDMWVKSNVDLTVSAFSNLNNIKLMYRDADLMDAFPEIGAALDTISEEACLYGGTVIKLLDGRKKTIRELYEDGETDMWLYTVDEEGHCRPTHVDKVIYKGKKNLYKITLDDGTELKCTDDHKWLLSDGSWKRTSDLANGDSMMSIYDKIDYNGYEKIKSTNESKFKHTHRIVAEDVYKDEKSKLTSLGRTYQMIVIHHSSFNKLNNDPRYLKYMFWDEHEKLHTDLNRERWEDEEFSKKMKTILSKNGKEVWRKKGGIIKAKMKDAWVRRKNEWTKDDLCRTYGRSGSANGMYDVHRFGSENPNFNSNKKHIEDIPEEAYLYFITHNIVNVNEIAEHFNMPKSEVIKYNKMLCNKYKCSRFDNIKYTIIKDELNAWIKRLQDSGKNVTVHNISSLSNFGYSVIFKALKYNNIELPKERISPKTRFYKECDIEAYVDKLCSVKSNSKLLDIIKSSFGLSKKQALILSKRIREKYGIRSLKELRYVADKRISISEIKKYIRNNSNVSKKDIEAYFGLTGHELLKICKNSGYKDYVALKERVCNHRVISVTKLDVAGDVYDMVNSSVCNSFAVKCNDGHIISHNCVTSEQGSVVNVYSDSERIKSILEDLFVNRLSLQITAPMVIRAMCKYGNQFMLLDIDRKLGVKGWRQLPVFNVERIENGIMNPYGGGQSISVNNTGQSNDSDMATKFVWLDDNRQEVAFRDWQIAHFRLLTNSICIPYGTTYLQSARRHWRLLSLMEDMMLLYRLERSIERRVYKIYVGAIDDADVQAYVEQVANNFKRTPIIDPMTGQVDLRKNILSTSDDIFIPVRDPSAATPIDTLPAAQNLTAIDDIKFVQNKVLTALRIPKSFLNFEDNVGDGKNLALMDIRFTRVINRIQQAFLMELTKIASIHLYLLGFGDDITNFSITMNNPSTQAEQLQIDNLQKMISAVRDAVSDPGNGIPVMSMTSALKRIMKMSDKEIKQMFEEIRLEKGISAELEKTAQIIKRTGIFDTVDRIYGEPGAEYQEGMPSGDGGDMGGGFGGGGGGGFGGGLDDIGAPGEADMGDISGQEGAEPTADMGGGTEPTSNGSVGSTEENPNESANRKGKKLITESKNNISSPKYDLFEAYMNRLTNDDKKKTNKEISFEHTDIYDKTLFINEEYSKIMSSLDNILNEKKEKKESLTENKTKKKKNEKR